MQHSTISSDDSELRPVELTVVEEPGREPPVTWDAYAHDESDRADDVTTVEED